MEKFLKNFLRGTIFFDSTLCIEEMHVGGGHFSIDQFQFVGDSVGLEKFQPGSGHFHQKIHCCISVIFFVVLVYLFVNIY